MGTDRSVQFSGFLARRKLHTGNTETNVKRSPMLFPLGKLGDRREAKRTLLSDDAFAPERVRPTLYTYRHRSCMTRRLTGHASKNEENAENTNSPRFFRAISRPVLLLSTTCSSSSLLFCSFFSLSLSLWQKVGRERIYVDRCREKRNILDSRVKSSQGLRSEREGAG